MSVMVSELYEALRSAGVPEPQAAAAAHAVLVETRTDLATKADFAEVRTTMKADLNELRTITKAELTHLQMATRADLAELKAELIKWNVGTLIAMTAIYGGLVAALKIFA
jgi:hypothetical protein